MDDFKIWIYVIIGAIYLLSRLRKKQESKPIDESPEEPTRQTFNTPTSPSAPKQLTFEELLQEITQAKEPRYEQKESKYEPVAPKSEYVDYDDDLKDEEQDLEQVDYEHTRKDKVSDTYEEAKRQAFNRPSLEETMKVEDTVVKFSKFKVFEEDKRRDLLEEYTRDLHDPEGFKKALVLSEILNKRF